MSLVKIQESVARVQGYRGCSDAELRCRALLAITGRIHSVRFLNTPWPWGDQRLRVAGLRGDDGTRGWGEELEDALLAVVKCAEGLSAVVEDALNLLGGRVAAATGSGTLLKHLLLVLLEHLGHIG